MEYVQKLQQLNKMSREFRRFGLSAYADDALRDAEAVYGSAQVVLGAPQKVQSTFTEMVEETPSEQISHEDFQKLRAHVISRFAMYKSENDTKLKELQSQVTNVVSKMNEMIAKINDLEKEEPAPQLTLKRDCGHNSPQNHHRTAGYKSSDVAIEKYFYYGSKK